MIKKLTITLLALLVAALTSCGGGGLIVDGTINSGDDGSNGSGGDGGTELSTPLIVLASPAPASKGVDVNEAITITFTEPMDRSTIEEAFELIESSSGEWEDGEYEWIGSSTVVFTPSVPLAYSTGYLVRLQGEVHFAPEVDLSDKEMSINIEYSFTTEELPSLVSVIDIVPEEVAVDVSISTEIEMVFDNAVDPDLIIFSLSAGSVVEGSISWSNGNSVLIFTPDADLAYGTEYSISASGDEMESSMLSSFTTEEEVIAPRDVEWIDPADEQKNVPITTVVEIQFSSSVDTESVEAAFSPIRQKGSREVTGTFEWFDDDSRMVFTPDSSLDKNKWYDVEIADMDFSSSFKTAE